MPDQPTPGEPPLFARVTWKHARGCPLFTHPTQRRSTHPTDCRCPPDHLTLGELQALAAVAFLGSETYAADALGRRPNTIHRQMGSVRSKLRASSAVQAFYYAARDGLIDVMDDDVA